MVRRALSVLLALTFTLEVPGQARATTQEAAAAAPAGSPALTDVDARAEALFEEGKYLAAAKVWEDALAAAPESIEVRGQRNVWAAGAVNAFNAAFEADPTQCEAIQSSVRLADEYLRTMVATYTPAVESADDYVAMRTRRNELARVRLDKGCAVSVPEPVPEPASSQPEPVAVKRSEAQAADEEPQARPTNRNPGLAAGIGVSAVLGVAMLVTSVALYLPLRKIARSGPYQDIYNLAQEHGVATDSATDMCVAGSGFDDIQAACGKWDRQRNAFVATAVLAGVFGASTAVFTGLLIRKRRQANSVAARLREHQVQLGAAPRREGGAVLIGSLRF